MWLRATFEFICIEQSQMLSQAVEFLILPSVGGDIIFPLQYWSCDENWILIKTEFKNRFGSSKKFALGNMIL